MLVCRVYVAYIIKIGEMYYTDRYVYTGGP